MMPKLSTVLGLAAVAAAPFAFVWSHASESAAADAPAFVRPASAVPPVKSEPAPASAAKPVAPAPAAGPAPAAPAANAVKPAVAAPPPPVVPIPVVPIAPAAPAAATAHATPPAAAPLALPVPNSPEEALQRLVDGNARYSSGHTERPNQSIARRVETAAGQFPFAVIVTCSDSRVIPELCFDQGIGDLFVVRDAGHTLNDHVVGSVEYAVEHLGAKIVLVVGHERCGAVAAAVAGGHADGRISTIVDAIRPAVRETRNQSGDRLDNAVRGNARRVAKTLAATGPILSSALASGHLKIFAARYDLASGRVELLP